MKISFQASGDSLGESYEFEIPENIGPNELSKIAKDGELLMLLAERSGKEICEIFELSKNGRHADAANIAREIGFTEEAFTKNGGGLWLAVAVGVAALLYSQSAH